MSKKNLITGVAYNGRTTKAEAANRVDDFLNALAHELVEGRDVRITGFGSFTVVERPAREMRNPQNGEIIQVPAKKVVKFKAGSDLLRVVQ